MKKEALLNSPDPRTELFPANGIIRAQPVARAPSG